MKRKFVKPRVRDIGDISTIVQGTTTRPTESSRRWKMNIKPIQDSLGKLLRLRGVTFNWKDTGRSDIGLIAEETGQVVPEVVTYESNGIDAKGLDYGHLVGLVIEAVKDQQHMIEEQREEIQELKAAVKILASRQKDSTISALA